MAAPVAISAVLAERTLSVVLADRVGLAAAAARRADRAPPIRACQGRTERVPSASAAAVAAAAARTGWWWQYRARSRQRRAAMAETAVTGWDKYLQSWGAGA